jgi:CxxC motif-containing protein
MVSKQMICISCPLGCNLKVNLEADGVIKVTGNQCSRGESYGIEEALSPKRVVTATAKTNAPSAKRLPVKTNAPLPRELIEELLNEIYSMEVKLPVRKGDIVLKNIRGTGVNLIATRSMTGD